MFTKTDLRNLLIAQGMAFFLMASAQATKPKPPPSGDSSARATAGASVGDVSGGSASVNVGGVTVPVTTGSMGNVTGGDVSVGGDSNRAYALSNSLGDVDIAGCLGSTQWNTPIYGKQKLVLNWPCMAEFYLRNAMYENAAMAICNTEIRKEFETEEDCRAAHPFKAINNLSISINQEQIDRSEDEDEEHERLEAELEAVKADLTVYKEKARKATLEARYAVREAQKPAEVHPEVQQEISEYERRLRNARAAYAGEK